MIKKILLSIIFLATLFLPANLTFATSLLFVPSIADIHVGLHHQFKVTVQLDPEGQSINTLELHISYPHDLLKLSGIEDGSSFITMWLERAHEENDTVNLSGIVPRGFSGNINNLDYKNLGAGDVVTLIFDPIAAGTAVISATSSTALLNDGLGTPATLKYGSTAISIGGYEDDVTVSSTDITPPDFVYAEAHYDATLGGEYLFFTALDKDSGIDHYEIQENGVWKTVQSPYLIKQNGGVYYIKAIDRAGNERITQVETPATPVNLVDLAFWLALILMVVILFWLIKRFSSKRL